MANDVPAARMPRELQTREKEIRDEPWTPPQKLPEPNRRDGYEHKYIRISLMGNMDPTNASAMFREGWEPVKASEYPEIMHTADPTSRYRDNIEIGGLLLCRAPSEKVKQRRDYYAKMTQAQMDSVDNNFLRQKDDRSNMSLFTESKSKTSFGRGSTKV